MMHGVFITFEGGDGAGKSTHIRFLATALTAHGCEVLCLREPGGTDVGEKMRKVVLDPNNTSLSYEAELLVYEAARAQLVSEVIAPALERGAVVLCDRFTDSTVAYQGYGRGLDLSFVQAANNFACKGIQPDRTILMVTGTTVSDSLSRATHRSGADRMERAGVDFHERVNEAFAKLANEDPNRIRVVCSASKKSQTARDVFSQLADIFPWIEGECLASNNFFEQLDVAREAVSENHGAASKQSSQTFTQA